MYLQLLVGLDYDNPLVQHTRNGFLITILSKMKKEVRYTESSPFFTLSFTHFSGTILFRHYE